jgi:hypothetical protein
MWVGGQRHAPAALPLRRTWYPLYRRLGGLQADLYGSRKSRLHRDSVPDIPARSEVLYRVFGMDLRTNSDYFLAQH